MNRQVVLVTGAGGYLGGRLVAHLRANERIAVRSGSRRAPEASTDVVSIGQLDDVEQLRSACAGVSSIVHLAALNEIDSEREPERAVEVNINGTVRLLAAAKLAGVRRFVFLSTAHVYGAPLEGRIDEQQVTRPVHPYAITHRAAEDFVAAAGRGAAMETVILRLSNAVGAPTSPDVQRWTLLVNDLCRQVVTTGKLALRSSGLARRDFIAMTDACRAIEHVLLLPADRLPRGPANLGGAQSLRVIDIVEMVAERAAAVLAIRAPIERPAPAPGEASADLDYRIDLLRATGFEPSADLRGEIDATLKLCAAAFAPGGERRAVGTSAR
jgi:UDP-glucose 4-epimerase